MEKTKVFEKELRYIKDKNLRAATEKLIEKLPEYFFTVAASSTGKYHPKYALGGGGLVRHTKAAVRVAMELYNNETFTDKYTPVERDYVIIALLLHDGIKHGEKGGKYTVTNHPVLAAGFVLRHAEEVGLEQRAAEIISELILSHMGQWNTDYKSGEVLMPTPSTSLGKFVHLCDYIASRKVLEVPFDDSGNIVG